MSRRPESVHTSVRLNKDDYEWFMKTFPHAGSLTTFLDQCLHQYRVTWGNRPAPHELVEMAVSQVVRLQP